MSNTIDSFASSWATSDANSTSERSDSLESLNSEDFMDLMLAQLKNQDPTEPVDSNEMMAQMASFSTSAGVGELNDTANGLVASLQSSQALQASSLVGRSVLVPGDSAYLSDGGQIDGQVDLPASTTNLRVGIYDSSGQKVDEIGLGTQAAGTVPFSWTGTAADGSSLPAGTYQVRATADIDGQEEELSTNTFTTVESVALQGGGGTPTLNLADNRSVDFTQVREVR